MNRVSIIGFGRFGTMLHQLLVKGFEVDVFDIKKDKHTEIPAVTHVDGTGRLQSVDAEISPRYHKLISKFAEKTGVPILLNTSFNGKGEPIISRISEALQILDTTELDAVYCNGYLFT